MTTHYETLGIGENANADEIKKAYRKLASQHHPDKGGDTAKFQSIQSAYDTLQDPAKREQYDHERRNPGGMRFTVNGHEMNGMPPGMEDMFRNFGFNFGGFPGGGPFGHMHQQPRRNKDLRIDIPITLASTLEDQVKTMSLQTTNGHRENVEIQIPRGAMPGMQIKYPGLGDNFVNTLPRGDLYAHITFQPHSFEIQGLDVITTVQINCLTAMIGGEVEVEGIDGNKFVVELQQGTQPNSQLRIRDQGLWQMHGSTRGNLYVRIAITVPRNLTAEQIAAVRGIQSTL